MHKLAADSRHVDLMATEKQYGHVFRLYLGSQLVIMVSGANAVKEVLVTKSAEFAGRPNFYTGEVFSQGKGLSVSPITLCCGGYIAKSPPLHSKRTSMKC